MDSGYLSLQGTQIYYRRIGTGIPMIMLHGNGENHEIFRKQVAYLRRKYQVILMDSRGHGRSHMGSTELSISLMAEDVYQLMQGLKIEKAILFGFSDGANIAIQMAAQHPEAVLSVIAVSGNVQPKGLVGWFRILVKVQYYGYAILEKLHIPVAKKRQLSGLMAWNPQLTSEELGRIQVPVLILTGRKDIVKPIHSIEMGKMIPNAKVMIFRDSDHFTMFQRTEEYMKLICRYLTKCGL